MVGGGDERLHALRVEQLHAVARHVGENRAAAIQPHAGCDVARDEHRAVHVHVIEQWQQLRKEQGQGRACRHDDDDEKPS